MVKKEEGYEVSPTGNWNVAADYSKLKIMKNLYLADEYANIAKFGSSTLGEDLDNNPRDPIEVIKIKGFERLLGCLILLIDNSLFAIKGKTDKEELIGHRNRLKKAEKLIPHLIEKRYSQVSKITTINIIDKRYDPLLEEVLIIKYKINDPLNKNHLIFTDKEEFDPTAYKKTIMDQATTRG